MMGLRLGTVRASAIMRIPAARDGRDSWWIVLLAVLIIAGCSGGKGSSAPASTAEPSATVNATPEPLPPIVQETLDAVAKLRGLDAPPALKARVVTRAEMPAAFAAALTDSDRAWFARTTTLYRLLGYLRADQDYYSLYLSLAEGAILGFYNPIDDTLVVATEGGAASFEALSAGERGVLAHELVHAIQDYHFHLDQTTAAVLDDLDRNLAYTAVIEGDANTHQQLYIRRATLPTGAGPILLLSAAASQSLPLPISRELQFPYTSGAEWIAGLRAKLGTGAIDALLKTPPSGTWQVFHPDRTAFTPTAVKLPDLASPLGGGWRRDSGGAFGEFQWGNFLQTRLRGLDATTAAATWTGDHYDVYRNGAEAVAVFDLRTADDAALPVQLKKWLDGSGTQVSEREGVTAGVMTDGRTFLIRPAPGRTLMVIGSSETLARRALELLVRG